MHYLQQDGDHLVRLLENDIVSKIPHHSDLTLEQAKRSVDFFAQHFGEFVPNTRVIPYKGGQYDIRQPYIHGAETLGNYLQSNQNSNIPAKLKKQLHEFSDRARQVVDETGVFFDLIGHPYGLRGNLQQSSNLLIAERTTLWIVDTILSRGMISHGPRFQKIANSLLPGRRKRKLAFLEHLDRLKAI